MKKLTNIKTFLCLNPNSKLKKLLPQYKDYELRYAKFVFELNSENCSIPFSTSRYELVNDGWKEIYV